MKILRTAFFLVILGCLVGTGQAATVYVDSCADLDSTGDSLSDGDLMIIPRMTCAITESIVWDFSGKAITIRGAGPYENGTIIDCDSLGAACFDITGDDDTELDISGLLLDNCIGGDLCFEIGMGGSTTARPILHHLWVRDASGLFANLNSMRSALFHHIYFSGAATGPCKVAQIWGDTSDGLREWNETWVEGTTRGLIVEDSSHDVSGDCSGNGFIGGPNGGVNTVRYSKISTFLGTHGLDSAQGLDQQWEDWHNNLMVGATTRIANIRGGAGRFHDNVVNGSYSNGLLLTNWRACGDGSTQTLVVGAHDGANNASALEDQTYDFDADAQVQVNDVVSNDTDGSSCTITSISTTTTTNDTLNCTLSGGTDNDWDTGDVATVTQYVDSAGLQVSQWGHSDGTEWKAANTANVDETVDGGTNIFFCTTDSGANAIEAGALCNVQVCSDDPGDLCDSDDDCTGTCSGFFDGAGAYGYPARTQVGTVADQVVEGWYEWGNSGSSFASFFLESDACDANPDRTDFIQSGRDYYTATEDTGHIDPTYPDPAQSKETGSGGVVWP